MPNQYTKVSLQIEIESPKDTKVLEEELTKTYFSILKNHLPKNKPIIEQVITKITEEFQ
ncbi:hypothetical protein [Clostridium sp.]|uniref:hypothetical protein n=1 Tax=Clostridium sp. TaxID=1506 RepID=UPI002FC70055